MQVIQLNITTHLIWLLSFDCSFELNRTSHSHITMEAAYVTIDKDVFCWCICWLIALIMDWLLSVAYINQLIGNFVSQVDRCMSDTEFNCMQLICWACL